MREYTVRLAGKNHTIIQDDDGKFIMPDALKVQGGSALKPAYEPVIVARLPLDGTLANNVLKYGSGALNIDGSRVGTTGRTARGDTSGNHLSPQGAFTTGHDIVELQGGRWPANLIHDGSDEVVGMFPNSKDGVAGKRNAKNGEVMKTGLGPQDEFGGYGGSGSAARFFYSAKVSKRERDAGLEGFEKRQTTGGGGLTAETLEDGSLSTASAGGKYGSVKALSHNFHPTVKPISLTTYLAKLILPPKLDRPRRLLVPFAGSGSEVIGGYLAGWDEVLGVEREKEYAEIAEARIKHWTKSSPQSLSSSTSVPPESTDSQEILDI